MRSVKQIPVLLLFVILLACISTKVKAVSVSTEYDPPIVLQESESAVDPNSPRAPLIVPGSGTYDISVVLESGTEYIGQFIY